MRRVFAAQQMRAIGIRTSGLRSYYGKLDPGLSSGREIALVPRETKSSIIVP